MRSRIVEVSHHYLDTSAPKCSGIGRILDAECVDSQPAINSGRACCPNTMVAESLNWIGSAQREWTQ